MNLLNIIWCSFDDSTRIGVFLLVMALGYMAICYIDLYFLSDNCRGLRRFLRKVYTTFGW